MQSMDDASQYAAEVSKTAAVEDLVGPGRIAGALVGILAENLGTSVKSAEHLPYFDCRDDHFDHVDRAADFVDHVGHVSAYFSFSFVELD